MNDMRSFEHRLADELGQMAGPEPPVDALAVARSVAAQAPKRRFQSMFHATKFLLAGAIVAMFGGFLLSTVVTQQQDAASLPGAEASDRPTAVITGVVRTPATERPVFDVRLTVTLRDANAAPDAAPLGEWVLERANQVSDPFGFTIDYAPDAIDPDGTYVLETRVVESDNGRLFASGGAPIAVITDAARTTERIDIQLVEEVDEGAPPRLTGLLVPDPDLPNPAAPARLVLSIVDASDTGLEAAPLAEFTLENVTRLRPPRTYSMDYAGDVIEDAGEYGLVARLEDIATGEVLATSDGTIPVITKGNPVTDITVYLVPADSAAR